MAIITTPLPYVFSNGTTADATQVNADLNQIVNNVNANAAANGANADITSLSALTTISHAITVTAIDNTPIGASTPSSGSFTSAYTPKVVLTYGATTTLDCKTSNAFRVVLTGNITTFTINNAFDGQAINVRFKQDGTGSRTIAWPASFRWNGGLAPALSTAASAQDFLSAQYDATDATWVAALVKGVQ